MWASCSRRRNSRRSAVPRRREAMQLRLVTCARTDASTRRPYAPRMPLLPMSKPCRVMWLAIYASARPRLSSNFIHSVGQFHVAIGQTARIVRGKRHLHGFIDIEPLRMVIHFFRDQRHTGHEPEGLVEVLEHEFL